MFSTFSLLILFFLTIKATCKPLLILHNDGPAVLGSNVTFTAELIDYPYTSKFYYTFDDGVRLFRYITYNYDIKENLVFPSDLYNEQAYCMNITVDIMGVFLPKRIAGNVTCFELRSYLIGDMHIYRGNISIGNDVDEVAVGENVTIVLDIHDPYNYLQDAQIDYGWSIDMDDYITLDKYIVHNFTEDGDRFLYGKATATFPNSDSISGFFKRKITVKVPVYNVNVSGNPFLHHGDFLKLVISCNGTSPFSYCYEVLKENVTIENFTCSQVAIFTNCYMEINKFFTDGKYHIGIYLSNDVKEVKRIIEVMVYNVSIKPILSTVIIPIVCSLLTLIIIATGITYCIQQRNQIAVEVANFDFHEESDSYDERTFFEKIFDSVMCKSCSRSQYSCIRSRSDSDPLLSDESLPSV